MKTQKPWNALLVMELGNNQRKSHKSIREHITMRSEMNQVEQRIKQAKDTFLNSLAKVYCETCGTVFYEGFASLIMEQTEPILDFRYLAFRHAWDNLEHVVIVHFNHLETLNKGETQQVLLSHLSLFKQYLPNLPNAENLEHGDIIYSQIVNSLRNAMLLQNNPHGIHKADENWDKAIDKILCSDCRKEYNDVKQACYCCREQKTFMPWNEVEKIK